MRKQKFIYDDLSMIFGLLSIYFAFLIPPTGILLGVIGIFYEKKDMKLHKKRFDRANFIVILLGILLSITIFIKWLTHLFL